MNINPPNKTYGLFLSVVERLLLNSEIRDITCGKNVKIVEPVNLYECQLGDYVFVGPFTEIQSNVIIGNNCRIQSHSFICSLVNIGDNCFIGHGVMFINDKFSSGKPAGGDVTRWQKTHIGNDVSIGSNATILPVNITAGCVIGAGSVVVNNLEVKGIYAGNPARLVRKL